MRTSRAVALVLISLAASGCAVARLPARAIEAAGSGVIRAVTPDMSDLEQAPVPRWEPPA